MFFFILSKTRRQKYTFWLFLEHKKNNILENLHKWENHYFREIELKVIK